MFVFLKMQSSIKMIISIFRERKAVNANFDNNELFM